MQFCLQLILKRPSTQLIIVFCSQSSSFLVLVQTLFKNSESCVMNNDFSTGYSVLERGTRQGDPLSAYLFILALEVMFIEVRNDVNIAGVKIGGHSVKLSAYADDTFFFTFDIYSLWLILNTCDKFEEYSSLKLSVEKMSSMLHWEC